MDVMDLRCKGTENFWNMQEKREKIAQMSDFWKEDYSKINHESAYLSAIPAMSARPKTIVINGSLPAFAW